MSARIALQMAVPDVQDILRLLDERRDAEVIDRLERAIEQERTNPTIRLLLARAYERADRLADAATTWHDALFLAPESHAARAGLRRLLKKHPELSSVPDSSEIPAPAHPPDAPAEERPAEPQPADRRREEPNLDQLIRDLEGARIVPDPDFEPEELDFEEDESESFVSETLARIYAAQRQYPEAAQVYELLAEQQPDRAGEFLSKAQEMRRRVD